MIDDLGIATMSIYGYLTTINNLDCWGCGFISLYENLSQYFNAYRESNDVKAVLINIESSGGVVTGAQQAADDLYRLAQTKPVVMQGTVMASGGYLLASQASNIMLSAGGTVGSIGVRYVHYDYSKLLEQRGINVTELSNTKGIKKTLGSENKPFTETELAERQENIDKSYDLFRSDVLRGRPQMAASESIWETADVFDDKKALEIGMIDAIGSFDDAYNSLRAYLMQTISI